MYILKPAKFLIVSLLFLFALHTKAQTVYVAENGKKYHAKNCTLVPTGKIGLTLQQAKKNGYTACKHCKLSELKENNNLANKPKPVATKTNGTKK
jgi:hypothetical protein